MYASGDIANRRFTCDMQFYASLSSAANNVVKQEQLTSILNQCKAFGDKLPKGLVDLFQWSIADFNSFLDQLIMLAQPTDLKTITDGLVKATQDNLTSSFQIIGDWQTEQPDSDYGDLSSQVLSNYKYVGNILFDIKEKAEYLKRSKLKMLPKTNGIVWSKQGLHPMDGLSVK